MSETNISSMENISSTPFPILVNLTESPESPETYVQSLLTMGLLSNYLNTVLVTVGFLGIVGNTISGYIFTRPSMNRYCINSLLFGLTIWDSLYLFSLLYSTGVISALLDAIGGTTSQINYYWGLHQVIMLPMLCITDLGTTFFTLMVTVERFLYVCKPLESRTLITQKRTTMASHIATLITLIYNIPRWFQIRIEISHNPETSEAIAIPLPTDFGNTAFMHFYSNDIVDLGLRYALPLFLQIGFTYRISKALQEFNKIRKTLTRSEVKEVNITKIAVCVITVSLFTNIFMMIYWILGRFGYSSSLIFVILSGFMAVLNSSLNIIFYLIFSAGFRQEFKNIFKRKEKQANSSVTESTTKTNS